MHKGGVALSTGDDGTAPSVGWCPTEEEDDLKRPEKLKGLRPNGNYGIA